MPECLNDRERKDRNGDERRRLLKPREQIRRKRHFGNVEFVVPHLPEERFFDHEVEIRQIDAVKPDTVLHDGPRPVVVPARERQPKIVRRHPLPDCRIRADPIVRRSNHIDTFRDSLTRLLRQDSLRDTTRRTRQMTRFATRSVSDPVRSFAPAGFGLCASGHHRRRQGRVRRRACRA